MPRLPRFPISTAATLAGLATLTGAACAQPATTTPGAFRPPAVPLVAHDPYFSIWSMSDAANGGVTRHWTEKEQPLTSLVRVDGKTFSLLGRPVANATPMPQRSVQVTPTRTIYTFATDAVEVKMTFVSPLLPDDLDLFSRPATYIVWDVRALDGKAHATKTYFDASGLLAVNDGDQSVVAGSQSARGLSAVKVSAQPQLVLNRSGDDLRIEWGHALLGVPTGSGATNVNSGVRDVAEFTENGKLSNFPGGTEISRPGDVVLGASLDFGNVSTVSVSRHAILAYDDEYSIQYFGRNLRPYWRRNGAGTSDLLAMAERDYTSVMARCVAFDDELTADLRAAGGANYAYLGSLAYRQSFAAQKVVADANGAPLSFSKENDSNGCIATVDVLYPASPQMILLSPTLTKASLRPIMDYSASSRWKWPFAPHDLGQYPLANGQVYGGGERTEDNQMPVEETGNMLLMLAALAKSEGNAKFCDPYWPVLARWAAYLTDKGFDPESQLSTDDFAGHLAHNVNLSAKAIEALGAYAQLLTMKGDTAGAAASRAKAQEFAARWIKEGTEGDHTRLAFDKPGTWAQKYNLVWDRILGINLFPASVATSEVAYYRTKFNPYGIPLDSRRDYTKLDWTVWSATLTGKRDDFDAMIAPSVAYLNATTDRVPMNDWHFTERARRSGFKARSVVGGVFIKLLDDPKVWTKWVARDKAVPLAWAPFPKPPIVTQVMPSAENAELEWAYSYTAPPEGWTMPGFDVSTWAKGKAGFGRPETPGAINRTPWLTGDIWIRREFDLKGVNPADLKLYVHHDDDAQVYVNGILVANLPGATGRYEFRPMIPGFEKAFRKGTNTIAIHCRQTGGGQYIDAGFTTVKYPK